MKEIVPYHKVVLVLGEVWKLIPGYVATYASESGNIAMLMQNGDMRPCPVVKWHNVDAGKRSEKTCYLHAKVIDETYNIAKKAVHQLVSLAFHGLPPSDGRRYEPNHKDGDKLNNRPANLEWVTRSRNVEHIYEQGLHAGGVGVIAENTVSGEVTRYSSISAFARRFDLKRQEAREFVYKHTNNPYGDWLFRFDADNNKPVTRYQEKQVICKDYLSGTVKIHDSYEKASIATGLKAGTIRFRIVQFRGGSDPKPLGRYFFQDFTTMPTWPDFSEEEIQSSITRFEQSN